ncbi:MAG: N-6 DNA methylase [Candidatus Lokiarchaeota archaeon]|nr:N-6 DNA methylase [Candidatus Lokiarchaeota archaeon]
MQSVMDIEKIKQQLTTLIYSQSNIINEEQPFEKYVAKCRKNNINNEETVVQPFTISFLKILNYFNQHNLTIEEEQQGNKPDFYSDTFILECKSSRYDDFSKRVDRIESPKEQLERYLKSREFQREYGILFSLDRLEVFKLVDGDLEKLDHLSFSLINVLGNDISNFEKFVNTFYVKPISKDQKIKIIAETEKEDLITIEPKVFNKVLKSLIKDISIELQEKFIALPKENDETRLIKSKVCHLKKQMDLSSTEEAEQEFISQTSYIVLARILLTKCWEDMELIKPPNTYNGGFKKYIQDYNEKIEEVYEKALNKSQDIYYLFNPNNPYLLIDLSEDLIIDILFDICKYDFRTLDYDILGYIYEDYLDIEHRKKFGQYYTPPSIVNLILDRVGYVPEKNRFLTDDILDPASGSGTFLLNAVNRVLDSKQDGAEHPIKYKKQIENHIYGSELMLFPYLISEINILIQISPILKDVIDQGRKLNVFHVFPNNSFNLVDKSLITRLFDIEEDEIKGNKLMDPAVIERKRPKLNELQHKHDFKFVVGNPPYVANDTNPELFREMRELFTFCEETYHNKMDLFYWFIILGILKLREGGKLGFITTRYWIDKGAKTGVETLKEYILNNCYLREVIDLRNVTVFPSATGQENIVFVLQKIGDEIEDDFISIFRIQPRPPKADCTLTNCIFEKGFCKNDQEYLECLCSRESEWDKLLDNPNSNLGTYIKAFKSARKTSDLNYNRSWDIFYPGEGFIKDIMDNIWKSCKRDITKKDGLGITHTEEDVIKFVNDFFILRVGVMTTADEYFVLNDSDLNIDNERYLIKLQDSISISRSKKEEVLEELDGVIDSEGYIWLELNEIEKSRLINLYKTPSVYRHGLNISKYQGKLIFFEDESLYHECPSLVKYLEQFKEEIEQKLKDYDELTPKRPNKWITVRRGGIIRLPDYKDRNLYKYYQDKPKIFYNYRVGNDNIFGYTNNSMIATTDMYFFHKFGEKISIFYILAYLNSKLITFYFKERPIELMRQKTNVENDIPIFIPRDDNEKLLKRYIIIKERRLTKKLQLLEKLYRTRGFHFEITQERFKEVSIDLQKYMENVSMHTFDDLSYKLSSNIDIEEIDRKNFPIFISNRYGTENISSFQEKVHNSDVIFIYGSLEIQVNQKYYENVRIMLESYIDFTESPKFSELLSLKVPNERVLEVYKIQKERLESKLTQITADDKLLIESSIESILKNGLSGEITKINSIREILHFIDMAFIKMIAPDYKDHILTY